MGRHLAGEKMRPREQYVFQNDKWVHSLTNSVKRGSKVRHKSNNIAVKAQSGVMSHHVEQRLLYHIRSADFYTDS